MAHKEISPSGDTGRSDIGRVFTQSPMPRFFVPDVAGGVVSREYIPAVSLMPRFFIPDVANY